jgi:uncharacterized membrane protein YjjB (DUF3815 family)
MIRLVFVGAFLMCILKHVWACVEMRFAMIVLDPVSGLMRLVPSGVLGQLAMSFLRNMKGYRKKAFVWMTDQM